MSASMKTNYDGDTLAKGFMPVHDARRAAAAAPCFSKHPPRAPCSPSLVLSDSLLRDSSHAHGMTSLCIQPVRIGGLSLPSCAACAVAERGTATLRPQSFSPMPHASLVTGRKAGLPAACHTVLHLLRGFWVVACLAHTAGMPCGFAQGRPVETGKKMQES